MGKREKNRKKEPVLAPVQAGRRHGLFYGILFLLPVLCLLALEGGLRSFDYGQSLQLFIPVGEDYPDHLTTNPDVSLRYFNKRDNPPVPNEDYFLKQKPENGFRIFMLGGSTAAGWPYAGNMMPSRIIAERLADAFPDKNIEMVNVAFSAINTYTLLDFIDEILEHSPDLVLIYSGHNEFYGALGVGSAKSVGNQRWLVRTYLELQDFKLFLLLKNFINWLQASNSSVVQPVKGTLMQRMVEEKNIIHASPLYQQGVNQFEENMREIIGRFKAADVNVVVSELVSNLSDHEPFVSTAVAGKETADEIYSQAQQFEQQGRFEKAKMAYYRAKDLDALPFRAPEEFNDIINRLGAEFKVPVVPMKAYFEAESQNGTIGRNLMMEHLHPNSDGYFLMSEAFLDAMREARLVSKVWPDNTVGKAYRQQWGVTEIDHALAKLKIKQLLDHWPYTSIEKSGKSFGNLQPANDVEKLAFDIFYKKTDLITAHRELAKKYEEQGDLDATLAERMAVIELFPYEQHLYREAAWPQLKANRAEQVFQIIKRSLRVKPTAEAYRWLGQIYLKRDDNQSAITNFELSRKLAKKDDPRMLELLVQAYEQTGQHSKAQSIREFLKP
jgi:tetratricopeptide (TPR) repeat protein